MNEVEKLMEKPELKNTKLYEVPRIGPDDVLIIIVPKAMSTEPDMLNKMRVQIMNALQSPKTNTLIFHNEFQLKVVRKDQVKLLFPSIDTDK